MSAALASPLVTDQNAIEAVKRMDMPPSRRPALWKDRWDNSSALQREFKTSADYSAYMEATVTGRARIIGQ